MPPPAIPGGVPGHAPHRLAPGPQEVHLDTAAGFLRLTWAKPGGSRAAWTWSLTVRRPSPPGDWLQANAATAAVAEAPPLREPLDAEFAPSRNAHQALDSEHSARESWG